MPAVTIQTQLGERKFDGEQIAHSKTNRQPRWIEFRLWKLDDGTYASYRAGMSNVYHRERTRCYRAKGGMAGEPATVDNLPDDAVPCRTCKPLFPDELADAKDQGQHIRIRYETPRITVDFYATADAVIERLTTVNDPRKGITGTLISAPVADLFEQAARNDPEFRAALARRAPATDMDGPARSIGRLHQPGIAGDDEDFSDVEVV